MLLPTSCPVCTAPGPAPCDACRAEMVPSPNLPRPAGVDWCAALLDYQGAGRELVARLKYRNARSSVPFLTSGMAALVDPSAVDAVTWVPTSAARRHRRGFDQAEVLARAVARRLRKPCRRLLRRRPGPAQTGRSAAERRRGPDFVAVRRRRIPPRVLLVDDVVTTGATATAAAHTLRSAGVSDVHVVAAARTLRLLGARAGVHSGMAVCGSVVESRGQSQAKRPT